MNALVVSLHSHENPPAILRPAHVPLEIQSSVATPAGEMYARFETLSVGLLLRHSTWLVRYITPAVQRPLRLNAPTGHKARAPAL